MLRKKSKERKWFLTRGNSDPTGHWQCLEILLAVIAGGRRILLATSE